MEDVLHYIFPFVMILFLFGSIRTLIEDKLATPELFVLFISISFGPRLFHAFIFNESSGVINTFSVTFASIATAVVGYKRYKNS